MEKSGTKGSNEAHHFSYYRHNAPKISLHAIDDSTPWVQTDAARIFRDGNHECGSSQTSNPKTRLTSLRRTLDR